MSLRAMPLKRPVLSRSRWMTCATSRPPSAGTARANGTMAIGMGSVTPCGDGEAQLRERGRRSGQLSQQQGRVASFFMRLIHCGANVSSKLRSNSAGSGRRHGNGDAAIDRGLHRFTQRGVVDAAAVHADGCHLAARNLGDRHNTRDAGLCRGRLDPGPRRCARRSAHASACASSLLRTALPRSSASSTAPKFRLARGTRLFFGGLLRGGGIFGALFLGAFLSAAAFSAAAFSAAAFAAACFSASRRSASSRSFSSCAAFCSCSRFCCSVFSRSRGAPASLRSISAGSGLGGPCSSTGAGSGSGAGSGTGSAGGGAVRAWTRCLSARARRPPWLRWPAFRPGGGRCFQVNQPYTAAATMAECSRMDSAIARHRPLVETYLSAAASIFSGLASVPAAA